MKMPPKPAEIREAELKDMLKIAKKEIKNHQNLLDFWHRHRVEFEDELKELKKSLGGQNG